jgi:mRNA interferase MazF
VIVQTDPANRNPQYPNTVVVAVSTKGRDVPTHVRVEPDGENGLTQVSFIKCEQVLTISKYRLTRRLGRLPVEAAEAVNRALRLALAL